MSLHAVAPTSKGALRYWLDLLSTVGIVAATAIIIWRAWPTARSSNQKLLPQAPIDISHGTTIGSGASGYAVIEFSDFQCPYCGTFARTSFPTIAREFVDSGKVLWVFWHFPIDRIHPQARKAAEAAECAHESGRFREMHDLLFLDPKRLDLDDLLNVGQQAGVDRTWLTQCLTDRYTTRVAESLKAAQELGITGTPTFLLAKRLPTGEFHAVDRISGVVGPDRFSTALAQALGK